MGAVSTFFSAAAGGGWGGSPAFQADSPISTGEEQGKGQLGSAPDSCMVLGSDQESASV